MPSPEHDLAESVRATAAESLRKPDTEATTDQAEPIGDFRHNLLRMADLADATVQDARQARAELAYLRAKVDQEEKAHARTMEMLRAAEAANNELRQEIQTTRDINTRLRAHMEAMGNNILTAATGRIIAES